MKNIFIKVFLFFILIIISSCGFKILETTLTDFNIKNIKTSGEQRINYKIKNNLLSGSKIESKNLINIEIDTTKNKIIKEKNIKNQITKYQITINVKIKLDIINKDKVENINLAVSGDYSVGDNNSKTRNNEKNLIDNLGTLLNEKVIDQISLRINDN